MEFEELVKELWVDHVPSITAGDLVTENHYLHRRPTYIWHSFALYRSCFIHGIITFGPPIARQLQVSMYPEDPDSVLECSRIWVRDGFPKNTTSWFVTQALKRMPPLILVSYADTSVGHEGYIYRALNWHYSGSTKATTRTTTINGVHSRHNNDRNWMTTIDGRRIEMPKYVEDSGAKHRYWTVTGNRRERQRLRDLCKWPMLDWRHPITIASPPKYKISDMSNIYNDPDEDIRLLI